MMVSNEVNRIEELTEQILNECFGIVISESFPNTTIDEVNEMLLKANNYILETKNYIEKEGESYMKKVNNEELRDTIRKEAKGLIKANSKASTLDIIRTLEESYKMPKKDLHILCQEAREEIKTEIEIPKHDKGTIKATLSSEGEHGFEITSTTKNEEEIAKEISEKLPYTVTEEELEGFLKSGNAKVAIEEKINCKVDKSEFEFKAPSKLKILEQTIKGEYGTYIKSSDGVKTEKITVKNIKDLAEYKKAVEGEFDKGKEELNKKFNELQEERNRLNERANKNFNIIDEIEAVFQM